MADGAASGVLLSPPKATLIMLLLCSLVAGYGRFWANLFARP